MVHRQHAITDGQDKQRISENKKKNQGDKSHQNTQAERQREGDRGRGRQGETWRQRETEHLMGILKDWT